MRGSTYLVEAPQLTLATTLANAHRYAQSFCLDAGSRFTFIGCTPVATFSAQSGFVTTAIGNTERTQIDDPIQALARFAKHVPQLPNDPYVPFYGGLVGYVGFEWGAQVARRTNAQDPSDLPDAWFGLYDTVAVFDHIEQRAFIASMGIDANMQPDSALAKQRAYAFHEQCLAEPQRTKPRSVDYTLGDLAPVSPRRHYRDTARTVQQHMQQGQVERINFAQRYVGLLPQDPWHVHLRLREMNPSPYAMYLQLGSHQLSCSSPTCALQMHGDMITAHPVVGHGPMSDSLPSSAGAVAAQTPGVIGSLHRFEHELSPLIIKESYAQGDPTLRTDAQAYHLSYPIQAQLRSDHTPIDVLSALVPNLSMTGYPKQSAIELLAQHEPFHRNAYTGAMGYWSPNQQAQFSLCVRLLTMHEGLGYVHAASWLDQHTNAETTLERTDQAVTKFFSKLHQQPITEVHEQSLY